MSQQVFPTKSNLISCKKSLSLARLGFELLDRKRNVLMREMMRMVDEAAELQREIGDTFTTAYKALQYANITHGIGSIMMENAPVENGFSISSRSVMGVDLPQTSLQTTAIEPFYGFSKTEIQLDKALVCFDHVKKLTAMLAGVENSVYRLSVAIKKTKRRANMLENVVIPRYEQDIKFIQGVLEEREREEFSRLKVIKRVKSK